jgi:uncharacterized RDD family membrane protein YckC
MVTGWVAIAFPLVLWFKRRRVEARIEFQPFANWYSTVLPVFYSGLPGWGRTGRTPGKWRTGIRIVSLGTNPSLFSLERTLGYWGIPSGSGFGLLSLWRSSEPQAVHDRIAETIVAPVPR